MMIEPRRPICAEAIAPTPSQRQGDSIWLRICLLFILLLGAVLRFYQLDGDSLWVDEIITQDLAHKAPPVLLDVVSQYDDHPPLVYLVAYSIRWLGRSDFVARLPAAFAGILTIAAVYAIGRRLWGQTAGLLAGMLTATWPLLVGYSQEARQYALLVLLCALSMYWLVGGLQGRQRRAWFGFTLATIGAFYTHYFSFLWLAAQGLYVFGVWLIAALRTRRRGAVLASVRAFLLPFAAAVAMCALAYVPWYRSLLLQSARLMGGAGVPAAGHSVGPNYVVMSQQLLAAFSGQELVLRVFLMTAALAGLVVALAQRRWTATACVLLGLVVPVLVLGLIPSPHFFAARYLLPVLIPLLLLCALGLSALHAAVAALVQKTRWAWTSALVMLLLPALLLPFVSTYYTAQKEDWRSVARYLAEHRGPTDVIIGDGTLYGAGGDALRVQQAVGYYLDQADVVLAVDASLADHLPPQEGTGTAWGVIWHQGPLADRERLSDTVTLTDFKDLTILQLRRPSAEVWNDTADILEAMLRLQPLTESHTDLHLALVQLYTKMRHVRLAQLHLEAALATVSSDDPRIAGILATRQVADPLEEARLASAAGDLPRARSAYTAILASDPAPDLRFAVVMEWGIMERFHANPAKAVALFEQALTLRPDEVEAHANYGAVLLDAGRLAEASQEFDWVAAHAPTHFWAYYLNGLTHQRMNNHEVALGALRKALTLASDIQTQQLAAQAAFASALQLKDCIAAADLLGQYGAVFAAPDQVRQQLSGICP